MTLLSVDNLTKSFGGIRAIDNVSFVIKQGAVHSIIGPNGAGKTTLLNLLSGLVAPDAGSIRLDGVDLTGAAPYRMAAAGLGRTFQNLQVFFNMSALENVMTGRHLRERDALWPALLRLPSLVQSEIATRERALQLLAQVGLADWAHAPAESMPYGSLKRLEIARALAAEPKLLLLDEPAAGLNATEAQAIDALIKRLAGMGTTVILVEHNMKLVMGVSDHLLVLDQGRVLAEGTPSQVRANPSVIEAYLGADEPEAAHA
ncbi:MAG: ABC transporter ATP-binding protein [Burkholderiaceae bacterium]|nr:ABC transporter ATP-binding protein [Burkholderiaceae bacterium]